MIKLDISVFSDKQVKRKYSRVRERERERERERRKDKQEEINRFINISLIIG